MLKRIFTLSTIMALSLTAYANCSEEVPFQDKLAKCKCEKEENTHFLCNADELKEEALASSEEEGLEPNLFCNADELKDEASLARNEDEILEQNLLCNSEEPKEDLFFAKGRPYPIDERPKFDGSLI